MVKVRVPLIDDVMMIEPPERVPQFLERLGHGRCAVGAADDHQRAAAQGLDLLRHLVQLVLAAAEDGDIRSLARQPHRGGRP